MPSEGRGTVRLSAFSACDSGGASFTFNGHRTGGALFEAVVKGLSILLLALYIKLTDMRAGSAPQNLVLPIFRAIIWAVLFVDLFTALLLLLLVRTKTPILLLAVSWALSRFITEGLTGFLVQHGAGKGAIRRSTAYAAVWACISFVAFFLIRGYPEPTVAHAIGVAYFSVPLLAYSLLTFMPIRVIPRRPSVRPVAVMMFLLFLTQLVREALRLAHVFLPAPCWGWSAWALVVWAAFPWVTYRALQIDSQWWSGLYNNPSEGNLNAPLLGVFGALSVTPAAALASMVSDLEDAQGAGGGVPVISFGQLRLRVEQKYASGSNSRVYMGEYNRDVVAVKMLFPMELDIDAIEAFCQEARILHSLAHPNILACRGVCIMPPALCLVTEFCENGSLFSFLKQYRGRPHELSWPARVGMMRDCAAGVAHIHSRGLVHTDIKGLNFMVKTDMVVKLGDLGECRREGQEPEDGGPVHPTTAFWSPPEVLKLRAMRFTASQDVWSLGLVMYEVVALAVPFTSEPFSHMQHVEFVNAVDRAGLRPAIPPDAPEPIKDLITRCWRRQPDERPTSADILCQLQEMIVSLPAAHKGAAEAKDLTECDQGCVDR